MENQVQVAGQLSHRVKELEEIVRNLAPDYDLSHLSPIDTLSPSKQYEDASQSPPQVKSEELSEMHKDHPEDDQRARQGSTSDNNSSVNPDEAAVFETQGASKGAYMGSASGMAHVKSLQDSAQSLLGVRVDLSEMNPVTSRVLLPLVSDMYIPKGAGAYRDPSAYELPPRALALEFCKLYFQFAHTFLPIVHRSTLMHNLEILYSDPTFTAPPYLIYQLNIIFAHSCQAFLPIVRKSNNTALTTHEIYYRRALSFFEDLFKTVHIGNIQALLLTLVYLHGLAKTGSLWHLNRTISALAMEMGLHRGDSSSAQKFNPLDREMRRRVFWCCLSMDRRIAFGLGRPLAITDADMDVQMPLCWDDEYITMENVRQPSPHVIPVLSPAIHLFGLIRISGHVHERLYTARKPSRRHYVEIVRELEGELSTWLAAVPPYLRYDSKTTPQTHPFFQPSAELHVAYNELRSLIRHPSLARLSPSPTFSADGVATCVRSSREILAVASHLKRFHMLGMHHHFSTTVLLATLTILYSLWDKRSTGNAPHGPSPAEVEQVRGDMDTAIDLIGGITWTDPEMLQRTIALLTSVTIENVTNSSKRQALHARKEPSEPEARSQQNDIQASQNLEQAMWPHMQRFPPPVPVQIQQRSDTRPAGSHSPRLMQQMQQQTTPRPMSEYSFSGFTPSPQGPSPSYRQSSLDPSSPPYPFGPSPSGTAIPPQQPTSVVYRPGAPGGMNSLNNPALFNMPTPDLSAAVGAQQMILDPMFPESDVSNSSGIASAWDWTTGWDDWMLSMGRQAGDEMDMQGVFEMPWQVQMPLQPLQKAQQDQQGIFVS